MNPVELTTRSTLTFIGALALIVLYRIITGDISLRGLLTEDGLGTGRPRRLSAARVQLLTVAVLAAAITLASAISQMVPSLLAAVTVPRPIPPALAFALPVAVGLSNAVFLWDQYRRAARSS
jgi:hypothetical protein